MRCNLCAHNQSLERYSWPDFNVLECAQCGFQFVDCTSAKYPKDAQYHYDEPAIGTINPAQPHIRRRVREILKYARPPGRALDIGCGKGEVVISLSQQGFECTGVDMKARVIATLQRDFQAITWHCATTSELEAMDERFDIITLYHVLEHIPQPIACLQQIKRLALPGALIVIEVPNVGGWEARLKGKNWHYFKVDHVNYFRQIDLLRAAEQAGLRVLECKGYQHFSYPQDLLWKDFIKRALAKLGFQDVISVFLRV